ncbi:serine/threonine-protein kinase [Acanthopleuribacter pedis]|uniref:Serine/threonine protein kinase n=1 Tax=Acanthopleuribacter pedis TaxID=442870 RepID=A0A8J7Q328_9BACT|nr:serine/threonine-protein kinase [Acanthopleuribacter pedis]MBO1317217.1 serine/threonine protein kinase [Acanthopleuribacter pedis]MBO1318523.1 serine/threonine protein kinase [Acanthopleuribacter pedis]
MSENPKKSGQKNISEQGSRITAAGPALSALEEETFIPHAEDTIPPRDDQDTLIPLAEDTIPPHDDQGTLYPEAAASFPPVAGTAFDTTLMPADEIAAGSTTPVQHAARRQDPLINGDPEYIGPFAVQRKLGQGAMGWVYLAEQLKPKRLVALKLIHRDVATHAFRARFEQEYQTLAGMNHDNVARIYSVGTTADGTPYFSMEYIAGSPIDDHCRALRLPLDARLRLFLQVCDGVLHAHQRAVVHRDLKPANILVSDEGSRACAKLIDFGIAKNLKKAFKEEMLETQIGSLVGTPAYMSPEQFGGSKVPVDTRTDVYSLGVLLYQLLTDQLPLEGNLFENKSWDQCIQIYRETEPSPPSQRTPLPDDQRAHFNTPAAKALRGDLDWIVMKAMSKTPERRYETVAALRQDILNYLDNRPVSAGPPSLRYHLRKTLRRHRNLVLACTTLAVGLAIGLGTAVQSWRETEVQRAKATYLSDFLWGILESPDPRNLGRDAKLVDLIDNAVDQLENRPDTEPEIKASILGRLGATYSGLGSYDQALPLLENALDIHRASLGEIHSDTLRTKFNLAALHSLRGSNDTALSLFQETLTARQKALGPHHPKTRAAVNAVALSQNRLGHYETATNTYLSNLGEAFRPNPAAEQQVEDPSYLIAMSGLAISLMYQNEHGAAAQVLEEAIPLLKHYLGNEHPDTLAAINNHAGCLRRLKHFAAAEQTSLEVVAIRSRLMGPDHPDTLKAQVDVGRALWYQKRYEEAYTVLCEVWLDQFQAKPYKPSWVYSANMLAYVLFGLEDQEGCATLYEEILRKLGETGLLENRAAIQIFHDYSMLLAQEEQWEKAEDFILTHLERVQRLGGKNQALAMRESLAKSYLAQNKREKALPQIQFLYNYAPNETMKQRAMALAKQSALQLD